MNHASNAIGGFDKDSSSMTNAPTIGSNESLAAQAAENVDAERSLHRDLIEAACAAPSADNNQPWQFRPTPNGLVVYWDRARRLPSDVDGMFDLLSLGAAIENVSLKISGAGRAAHVSFVDMASNVAQWSGDDLQPIADISCGAPEPGQCDEGLGDYVSARQTTRTLFSTKTLPQTELDEIKAVAIRDQTVGLDWVVDRKKIKSIASLVALSDSLRFRYRDFHDELHRQLRLTAKHAEQTRDGLDYRTLGLPPGGRSVLRAIRNWKTMSFLNRLGMATMLSIPSARLIRHSGAIGFFSLEDRSIRSMIQGGRAMQRMWLQAAKMGLSVHPLGSLPIFLANHSLPSELQPIANRVRSTATDLVPTPDRFLQMAFRIGIAKRSSGIRSLRRVPSTVTIPVA